MSSDLAIRCVLNAKKFILSCVGKLKKENGDTTV